MLQDSGGAGLPIAHQERLEIVFLADIPAAHIESAWATTVARTAVLQAAPAFPVDAPAIPSWRVDYWESERRFIWTFHHALLDGRSITAIVGRFLKNLLENEIPPFASITCWTPATAEMQAVAEHYFASFPPHLGVSRPPPSAGPRASMAIAVDLESLAHRLDVSVPTLFIWAWAQAITTVAATEFAIIEQVRCGAPQEGCIGFSMNTLPLCIPKGGGDHEIQELRRCLRFLREIETISPYDYPLPIQAHTRAPWASVVMVETKRASHPGVFSITLHEAPAATISASAYLTPSIHLVVEGPASEELLAQWADGLRELATR